METKVCNECREEKEASAFFSSFDVRDGKTRLSAACRPCTALRTRRNRQENPERVNANQRRYFLETTESGLRQSWPSRDPEHRRSEHRAWWLPRKFGITIEQYHEMLARQGGVCAICKRPETMTMKGTVAFLAVDHDSESGRVRGLLCFDCNTGLGKFGEDVEMLLDAAEYLMSAASMPILDGIHECEEGSCDAKR